MFSQLESLQEDARFLETFDASKWAEMSLLCFALWTRGVGLSVGRLRGRLWGLGLFSIPDLHESV